jgi:ornithine cyclodeaminase/alanine dehydrogenase-like protein (mu-crystallin family)
MVVVDDIRQASSGGEINVPISKGIYSPDKVYGTLPELVSGRKKGRIKNDTISVFDSTGIAIEDIATARLLYEKAIAKGGYPSIELV